MFNQTSSAIIDPPLGGREQHSIHVVFNKQIHTVHHTDLVRVEGSSIVDEPGEC